MASCTTRSRPLLGGATEFRRSPECRDTGRLLGVTGVWAQDFPAPDRVVADPRRRPAEALLGFSRRAHRAFRNVVCQRALMSEHRWVASSWLRMSDRIASPARPCSSSALQDPVGYSANSNSGAARAGAMRGVSVGSQTCVRILRTTRPWVRNASPFAQSAAMRTRRNADPECAQHQLRPRRARAALELASVARGSLLCAGGSIIRLAIQFHAAELRSSPRRATRRSPAPVSSQHQDCAATRPGAPRPPPSAPAIPTTSRTRGGPPGRPDRPWKRREQKIRGSLERRALANPGAVSYTHLTLPTNREV